MIDGRLRSADGDGAAPRRPVPEFITLRRVTLGIGVGEEAGDAGGGALVHAAWSGGHDRIGIHRRGRGKGSPCTPGLTVIGSNPQQVHT